MLSDFCFIVHVIIITFGWFEQSDNYLELQKKQEFPRNIYWDKQISGSNRMQFPRKVRQITIIM
jgi:hypothetical protein